MSGVYALVYKNEVIYVGQSCDIQARLRAHHGYKGKLNELRKRRKPYSDSTQFRIGFYSFIQDHLLDIQFLAIPVEPRELIKTEEYYINKYKPRFNYIGVVIPHYSKP